MKLFDKYRKGDTNEEELNTMTESLIKQKFDQELRQRMSHRLEEEYGIRRTAATRTIQLNWRRWSMGVAAALLIGIVAWQAVGDRSSSYQSLTEEYLALHYANNETRKGASDISEQRGAAIDAYNREDFATSARLRTVVTASEEATTKDFFFLGLSYLYQNPPDGALAIEPLRLAMADPSGELQDEAKWYLTLAYVSAGQFANARELLDERISAGVWKVAEAKALLHSLPKE